MGQSTWGIVFQFWVAKSKMLTNLGEILDAQVHIEKQCQDSWHQMKQIGHTGVHNLGLGVDWFWGWFSLYLVWFLSTSGGISCIEFQQWRHQLFETNIFKKGAHGYEGHGLENLET